VRRVVRLLYRKSILLLDEVGRGGYGGGRARQNSEFRIQETGDRRGEAVRGNLRSGSVRGRETRAQQEEPVTLILSLKGRGDSCENRLGAAARWATAPYRKRRLAWKRQESAFLQSEPKLKTWMCFGVKELCKMQDGFDRRSEPKLKGVKMPEKAKVEVISGGIEGAKPRSPLTLILSPRGRGDR